MKELRKYALKSARRPKQHALLSGVVHVKGQDCFGVAYIQFSESFVDAVGKALPQGLSPSRPGYLKFLYMPASSTWRLFAMYLNEPRGVLLWEAPELPSWVSNVVPR